MTQQINLYNPALRARREWLTGKTLLYGLGVLGVLLGLYGGVLRWHNQQLSEEANRISAQLARQKTELSRLNEEIEQRKLSSETQAALQHAEAVLRGRERVREALGSGDLGSSEGFSQFLRAFARQTQEGLWLVGLEVAEGGRNISLEGRTLNPDQIPAFIRGLNGEPTLRGRTFEALNLQLVTEAGKPAQTAVAAASATGSVQDGVTKIPSSHEFLLAAKVAMTGNSTEQGRQR